MPPDRPAWPGNADIALDAWAQALGGRRRGSHVSAPCPVHQGSNFKLYIYLREDRLAAHCYSGQCQEKLGYRAFAAELERITGLRLSPDAYKERASAPVLKPPPPPQNRPRDNDLKAVAEAQRMWRSAGPIPTDPRHPARRWLNSRHLWRPEFPAPDSLRWLPMPPRHGSEAAGMILAPAAPPGEWVKAWPRPPDPQGVQRIPVTEAGESAGNKRSRGAISGNIFLLGNPDPEDPEAAASVTEGVADALAVASRQKGPAVCTLGTGGMTAAGRSGLARWLASYPAIRIWADRDEGKNGFAPAGLQAARKLQDHIKQENAAVLTEVCHVIRPHKDPAAAAAAAGFPELDSNFAGYAATLAAIRPEWPRWHTALLADLETAVHS